MSDGMLIRTTAIVVDTFREAFARKIFWGLFVLSTLMILFFLFIMRIDIVQGAMATISLFGMQGGNQMDVARVVKQAEAGISTFLYSWGMFLAVFASAGLIPSVLEPGRIELLLSKPVSRRHLLLGRYLGNLLIVGLNVTYLVLGVWLILALKTGIWHPEFLIAIPSTMFLFGVLLALVVLIGVVFESTALAVMVPVGIMIISPITAQPKIANLLSGEFTRFLWKAIYHVLPKVYDIGKITLDFVLNRQVESYTPLWTSAVFGTVVLAAAIYIFEKRDF